MHGEVVASDGVGVMLDGVDSDGSVVRLVLAVHAWWWHGAWWCMSWCWYNYSACW